DAREASATGAGGSGGGAGAGQGGTTATDAGDASSTGAGHYVAPPIAEADFLPTLERIWCDDLLPCCVPDQRPFDLDTCHITIALLVTQFRSPRNMYDPLVGGACIQRSRALTAACVVDPNVENWVLNQCLTAYSAGVPLGATCTFFGQCAGSPDGVATC